MKCCEDASIKLDYLNHRLRGGRRKRFATHLASCESCRQELAALATITEAARRLPRETAPEDLKVLVEQRLAARGAERNQNDAAFTTRGWWTYALSCLLALSGVFTLVLGALSEPGGRLVSGLGLPTVLGHSGDPSLSAVAYLIAIVAALSITYAVDSVGVLMTTHLRRRPA